MISRMQASKFGPTEYLAVTSARPFPLSMRFSFVFTGGPARTLLKKQKLIPPFLTPQERFEKQAKSFFAESLHPMFANLYITPPDPLPTPA
jgi:hypothetical protein